MRAPQTPPHWGGDTPSPHPTFFGTPFLRLLMLSRPTFHFFPSADRLRATNALCRQRKCLLSKQKGLQLCSKSLNRDISLSQRCGLLFRSAKFVTDRLQRVLNAAARIVFSPILASMIAAYITFTRHDLFGTT